LQEAVEAVPAGVDFARLSQFLRLTATYFAVAVTGAVDRQAVGVVGRLHRGSLSRSARATRHRTGASSAPYATFVIAAELITPRIAPRPEIRVHPAATNDFAEARRVISAAYAEYAPALGPALHASYLDDLLDLEGRTHGQLLVVKVGRQVAGTVTFFADASDGGHGWPSEWATVRAIGVDPAFRGLGIARRMMNECLRRADASGADVIGLHTARFMGSAVRLYEGLGFQRVPEYDFDAATHLGAHDRSVQAAAYARPVAPAVFGTSRASVPATRAAVAR
jgi:ribosomal protein S18 acetylase RimI-like enzyme